MSAGLAALEYWPGIKKGPHKIAGTLEQHGQHLQGLSLKTQFYATLAKLARSSIEYERVETEARCG